MITVDMNVSDAMVIYRNLRNHFINPDDQRIVYDFVHLLDKLIEEAKLNNDARGKLG